MFDKNFYWSYLLDKKIDIKDVDDNIEDIYSCKYPSIFNYNELLITPLSPSNTFLNNKMNVFNLVMNISNKHKKTANFQVINNNGENFSFTMTSSGLIPTEENDSKVTPKNVAQKTKENLKSGQEKRDEMIEKNIEFVRNRDADEHKAENIGSFLKNNDPLQKISGTIEKIKTINPLLTDKQIKQFNSESFDEIEYEYNSDSNSSDFGKFSKRPGMGYMLMIQNVVTEEEPKDASSMLNYINKKLTKISNNFTKADYILSLKSDLKKIEKKLINVKTEMERKDLEKQKKHLTYQINNTSYCQNLPLVYKDFLNNWMEGKGKQDVSGSGRFWKAMTSYFPEFTTPFVPLYASKNKDCISDMEPINLLKTKISGSADSRLDGKLIEKAKISFPLGKTNPLYDSVLMFESGNNKYQCILLSTKGGRSGEGASASIGGLKNFIYNSDAVIPQKIFTDCKNTHFDASLYTDAYLPYMVEFANKSPNNSFALKVLSAFMLSSSDYYQEIIDSICDVVWGKTKKSELEKARFVQDWLNSDESIQKCVLSALTYGSYGFAQINSKQIFSGSSDNKNFDNKDFHYEYSIQYPAIFKGHIDFSFIKKVDKQKKTATYKKLQFHIIGNKY